MARVKRGKTTHQRHKRLLEHTKGYRMSRRKLHKVAKESYLHAGEYAFAGRKHRKRQFRRLWILRLNAALRQHNIKYSEFIHQLKIKQISLDRKILAYLAQDSELFAKFLTAVNKVKLN